MRFSFGGGLSVTTQERWLNELRAGRCFASPDTIGPVAGQFPQLQLENPLGSGKTVLVYGLVVSTTVTQIMSIRYQTALLATLVGTCQNLRGSLANSTAQLRNQTSGAIGVAPWSWSLVVANEWNWVSLPWLAELAPADTLWISGHTLNTQLLWAPYFNEF